MGYICLFCGKEIEPNEVLFHESTYNTAFFTDTKRYNYLYNCTQDYPFVNGDKFRGLYFRCEEPNVVKKEDANGFPTMLIARPCNGMTATELAGEIADLNETAQKSTQTEEVRLTNRVCPHCHCHLPPEFGQIPNYSICLMGGRAAGKTAYLVCLLQQINLQLQSCNLGNAVLVEESRDYFQMQMDAYNETGMTLPTPTNARLLPLVLRYANPNMEACYISLYDIAGEGTVNELGQVKVDYIANHKGIANSNTIMLMLDPNMLCDGQYFRAQTQRLENMTFEGEEAVNGMMDEQHHDYCSVALTTFLSQCNIIKEYLTCDHIISVVTKMDQPLTSDAALFAGATNLLRQNNISEVHRGAVNLPTLGALSNQLAAFINTKLGIRNGEPGVRELIQRSFESKKPPLMLGVSTYTKRDDHFVNLYTHDAPKHRILEPFMAILVNCGVVPTAGGKTQPPPPPPQTGRGGRGLFGRRR